MCCIINVRYIEKLNNNNIIISRKNVKIGIRAKNSSKAVL